MEEIDVTNYHLVALGSRGILIMNPPRGPMTNDQALTLAAWLVALADPGEKRFADILGKVQNT